MSTRPHDQQKRSSPSWWRYYGHETAKDRGFRICLSGQTAGALRSTCALTTRDQTAEHATPSFTPVDVLYDMKPGASEIVYQAMF